MVDYYGLNKGWSSAAAAPKEKRAAYFSRNERL